MKRRLFLGGLTASLATPLASCTTQSQKQTRQTSSNDADIIVIGAGLSGLHATWKLEQAGLNVLLIEANDRIGGRLYTLDDLPGTPDAGGIQVGSSYQNFHEIADRLGVERYAPEASKGGYIYNISGSSLSKNEWHKADKNILPANEAQITPDVLFFRYLRKLPVLPQIRDWMNPASSALDMPLSQWLKSMGASDEAMRLMNANLNGYTLGSMSTLHMQRSLAIYANARNNISGMPPVEFVRGGSQRMTDAMVNSLKSDRILNAPVTKIKDTGGNMEITLSNGRVHRAKQVICTIPFTALRNIEIDAPLPKALRHNISNLPYTKAIFMFLRAKKAFWKEDGLPEYIWSDHPLIGRVFTLNGEVPLLKIWVNGPAAENLDKMDAKNAAKAMITQIEQIRPSARGNLSYLKMFSWQKQKFTQGIYHHIGNGMAGQIAASTQYKGRRLHFAGEHMAQASSGMEAALESAKNTVKHILENS